ncbi:MAG TPA: hypothetical protein VF074_09115 [Pyrinomonadaceae bacterium]
MSDTLQLVVVVPYAQLLSVITAVWFLKEAESAPPQRQAEGYRTF